MVANEDKKSVAKEQLEQLGVMGIPKETLDFFRGDEIRARVFYEKYALRDETGEALEKLPSEMWDRIAREMAGVEPDESKRTEWTEKFNWLMQDFRFIPGGRIMFGAGAKRKATLLNCYVVPIKEDSIEGIFDWCKEAARTYSFGGGVGGDISILRPKGAPVNNSAIRSTGAVSFMGIMGETTHSIGQSGRRGALMITISVDHPDIFDFIRVKQNLSSVKYANISVRVTDEFMNAVVADGDFTLRFGVGTPREVERKIRARELWNELIQSARDWAEPGLMFWDTIKKNSPSEYNGMEVITTNPCLSASTFLQTQHGLSHLSELETKRDFAVADSAGAAVAEKVWITGEKDVYRIETALGYHLDATLNHLVKGGEGFDLMQGERRVMDVLKDGQRKSAIQIKEESGFSSVKVIYTLLKFLKQKGLVETDKVYERKSPKPIRKIYARATEKARLFKEYEWMPVEKLDKGSRILMSVKEGLFPAAYVPLPKFAQSESTEGHKRNVFVFPRVLDEPLAALLGWMVSDGTALPYKRKKDNRLRGGFEYRMGIISINNEEDSDIRAVIKASFGIEAGGGAWRKSKKVKDWTVSGQNLKEFIEYFGIGVGHEEITVPMQIRKSPKSVVASFLKRVFEGDGTCVDNCVTLDSISYDLILTVQQLLLKFGIIAQLRISKRAAPRADIHVLTIRDILSLQRYAKEIGFVSTKHQEALSRIIERKRRSCHRNESSKYDWVDDTHIETPITRIRYLGRQTVYDCTTSTHSFVANGFIVHNCSEQPLQAYGACDLGAINLPVFVLDSFTDNARMDWASLEKAVRYSVRFLDNVLDYNADKHPLPAQKEAVGKSRRIGLGVTGLADMLAKLRMKYDSDEAMQFAERLFEMIKNTSYDESTEIAKEKGPFPLFDRDKHLSMAFVQKLSDGVRQKIAKNGLRNVALLTVAPVGSGSVLAGTSSGIEPIFAFNYTRRSESLSKEYFKVYHPLVHEYMAISGLMDDTKLPEFFVPAHKINADFRVRMQGTIQKHVDSAISSTVNLPADTTTEQVGEIYLSAWKEKCKGITVYREGSRQGILITDEKEKAQEKKPSGPREKWKRPIALIGKTVKLRMQQESLYVTSSFDEEAKIREVFINLGNTGSQEKSYAEAIGRLISKYLQADGDVKAVIESLKGIRATDSLSYDRGLKLYSVPDAIAKALEITLGIINFKTSPLSEHGKDSGDGRQLGVAKAPDDKREVKPAKCSECGENMLVYESGCYTCKNCGYTKC